MGDKRKIKNKRERRDVKESERMRERIKNENETNCAISDGH